MKVEVLGSVQDGGVPHLGCDCDLCESVRDDPEQSYSIASLLLKEDDEEDAIRYLIEATPDIRYQIRGKYLDGVFIPYAQIGNITGLLFLGEEGIDSRGINVYVNEHAENFLMQNDPFRRLIDRGNIEMESFEDGDEQRVQGGKVTAERYRHPMVKHNTTAYIIEGDSKTLFYLSDITEWNDDILERIQEADIAIIDGTFWSRDEIERFEEVPHPPIEESMGEMEGFETEIYFTHMNHTNPVLQEDSEERKELEGRGFKVAYEGLELDL
ncbi:MAG: MBL fold metallo-hydrolase [Candidatus Nanohaloarchaea archaeon]